MMTHDWPNGVVDNKDIDKICKIKPHWKEQVNIIKINFI
jgi:hypothetical protein